MVGMRESKIDKAFHLKHGFIVWLCRMMTKKGGIWTMRHIPPAGLDVFETSRPGTNNPEYRDIGYIGFTYWLALILRETAKDLTTWLWFRIEVMAWTKAMYSLNPQIMVKIPLGNPKQLYPELPDVRYFAQNKNYAISWGILDDKNKYTPYQFAFIDFHDIRDHEITIHRNPKDKKQIHIDPHRQRKDGPHSGWHDATDWIKRLNVGGMLPPWEYVPARLLWLRQKRVEEGTQIINPADDDLMRLT